MQLRRFQKEGFTLLELMVGLIIFIVGVIGFAGMVIMQTKANRSAKGFDESATIMQSVIESLNNVRFDDLGNSTALPTLTGLTNGNIWVKGPMNRIGMESNETGAEAPFIYYRNVVVCPSGLTINPGTTLPNLYCGGSVASNRPPELSCTSVLNAREKLIRVLVAWNDRDGKCHYKNSDFISFQWTP